MSLSWGQEDSMITTVCLNCGDKFEGRLDECPKCRLPTIKYRGLDTAKPVKKTEKKVTPKKEELKVTEKPAAKPAKKKAPKKKGKKRRAY
jgi:hypothetical protein